MLEDVKLSSIQIKERTLNSRLETYTIKLVHFDVTVLMLVFTYVWLHGYSAA